jgi:hypothetical protein
MMGPANVQPQGGAIPAAVASSLAPVQSSAARPSFKVSQQVVEMAGSTFVCSRWFPAVLIPCVTTYGAPERRGCAQVFVPRLRAF